MIGSRSDRLLHVPPRSITLNVLCIKKRESNGSSAWEGKSRIAGRIRIRKSGRGPRTVESSEIERSKKGRRTAREGRGEEQSWSSNPGVDRVKLAGKTLPLRYIGAKQSSQAECSLRGLRTPGYFAGPHGSHPVSDDRQAARDSMRSSPFKILQLLPSQPCSRNAIQLYKIKDSKNGLGPMGTQTG